MQYDDGAGYAAEVVDRSITATKAICGECIAGTDDAWTSSAPFTGTTGSWCTIKVHRSGRLYADQSRCRSRLRPRTHSSCSPIVRHKGGACRQTASRSQGGCDRPDRGFWRNSGSCKGGEIQHRLGSRRQRRWEPEHMSTCPLCSY
jgi:hypothetical protein